jgi:hypothetical protein
MDENTTPECLEMKDILERLRRQVKRLLARSAAAPDLSFALAYVATELGLVVSNDPARVLAVVLKGVSQASIDYAEAMDDKAGGEELPEKAPDGVTIH